MKGEAGQSLKEELVRRAREQGFFLCGVARAGVPPHAEAFRNWLAGGKAATMHWMARTADKRCHPELVLPGVRSVVMLGMNYWQGPRSGEQGGEMKKLPEVGRGKIARYAWGGDYHDFMLGRMEPLRDLLQQGGGEAKAYVDTGPVLERDFAQLGGLGWAGKSTMLIARKAGTWFFLAEILTTLALPPDEPEHDHCGSCTRCQEACPTGAISAAYQLDARKCLSYWTIEHKGPIPEEYRRAMGNRIYGCDDCLEACPWNRFATVSREAIFAARHWEGRSAEDTPLREFLRWTEEEFKERFRGSPIRRIKRERFLRNVCVALGNVGGEEDLAALVKAAETEGDLVAEAARWAIREIGLRLV